MHGFADTVRFRGRGLIVDCAVTTGHNRIIRGGAVMPFTSCSVSASRQTTQMSSISFWCVTLRTRCERCPLRKRTCVQQSHATCAQDNNTSWLLARGVQCVDWVPEPEVLCAPSPCLNIAVSVGTCWRLNDIHCSCMCSSWDMTCGVVFAAIGSYRGRQVVRRAASCALFDRDVCKLETSSDTFRGCTGVMSIAKTRGMRSCICHDLCHVARKHHHWTNKVCVRGKVS